MEWNTSTQLSEISDKNTELTVPEIEQLFVDIQEIDYPDDGTGSGGDWWRLTFRSDGTWEGSYTGGYNSSAFGKWRVKNNKQCVTVDGSDGLGADPFQGCFFVFINWATARVTATFPDTFYEGFVLVDGAFSEISRLKAAKVDRRPLLSTATETPAITKSPEAQWANTEGYRALSGSQIQRLFEDLEDVKYPGDGTAAWGQSSWILSFQENGAWEAVSPTFKFNASGSWKVDGNTQCIEIGYAESSSGGPFEGCFGVFVNTSNGTITGSFAGHDNERVVLKESAFTDIARTLPQGNREQIVSDERTLELVRQAMEQEQLEQQRKIRQLEESSERERELLRAELEIERNRVESQAKASGSTNVTSVVSDIEYGTYHAVVIGINNYKSLPKLKTAIIDARAVAVTLEEYCDFNVQLLENPTRSDIIDVLDILRETLTEKDNLLIYYAGHGWVDRVEERGYWLPVNAEPDRRSRWLANDDLTSAIKAIFAKHVMVVSDSCYSGTLTRTTKPLTRTPDYFSQMAQTRARVVLSSGGLEPVEDSGGGRHSVFAAQFLKALRDNRSVIDGVGLFQRVRHAVLLNAKQTPQYSDIRFAGHEGGDFLFLRKN